MISIVIPTFNNLEYLKLCINSLKKNSKYSHDIRLHINDGSDGTLDFANTNNIFYTHSNNNIGLCSSINLISSTVTSEYLLYAHDDMYFCPNWDDVLIKEVKGIGHNSFSICSNNHFFIALSALNVSTSWSTISSMNVL